MDKELQEIYPEGSKEREILEFSTSTSIEEEVPWIFRIGYKALIVLTIYGVLETLVKIFS